MIAKLADWVILFIDYQDMEIEDITIKLLKIEIPTGSGRRVNKIITVQSKRSIIQIRNRHNMSGKGSCCRFSCTKQGEVSRYL